MNHERFIVFGQDSTLATPPQVINDRREQPALPDNNFGSYAIWYGNSALRKELPIICQNAIRQFPNTESVVVQATNSMQESYIHLHPHWEEREGRRVLTFKNTPNALYLNTVTSAIYQANPNLLVFPYTLGTYVPQDSPTRYKYHYPGFETRLKGIMESTKLTPSSPIIQIMAVVYQSQIAKNMLYDQANLLRNEAAIPRSFSQAIAVVPYFRTTLSEIVYKIRRDNAYIASCDKTIERIATEANFSQDQLQLLFDVAFMKNRSTGDNTRATPFIYAIMEYVAKGNWEQAQKHVDFLKRYFGAIFPDWKRGGEIDGSETTDTLKQLAEAVTTEQATMPDGIPASFQELFDDLLTKSHERKMRNRPQEVTRLSVEFSQQILQAISERSTLKIKGFVDLAMEKQFGFTLDTIPAGTYRNDLIYLLRRLGLTPRITHDLLRGIYNNSKLYTVFLTNKSWGEIKMVPTSIIDIQLKGEKQVYWTGRTQTVDRGYEEYEEVIAREKQISWNSLLCSLINTSVNVNTDSPIFLNEQDLRTILLSAYQGLDSPPFTLTEYLTAIINQRTRLSLTEKGQKFLEEFAEKSTK